MNPLLDRGLMARRLRENHYSSEARAMSAVTRSTMPPAEKALCRRLVEEHFRSRPAVATKPASPWAREHQPAKVPSPVPAPLPLVGSAPAPGRPMPRGIPETRALHACRLAFETLAGAAKQNPRYQGDAMQAAGILVQLCRRLLPAAAPASKAEAAE